MHGQSHIKFKVIISLIHRANLGNRFL